MEFLRKQNFIFRKLVKTTLLTKYKLRENSRPFNKLTNLRVDTMYVNKNMFIISNKLDKN